MRLLLLASLTVALLSGSRLGAQEITIYRCQDGKGGLTLQDEPCPKDQQQSERVMTRPPPAPPRPIAESPPAPEIEDVSEPLPPPVRYVIPPPPMFICTSYDGKERESEVYDPNPRCEPYILYHPRADQLPPEWQTACRWVEDSCVQLNDAQACDRFIRKQREAKSAAQHSFSDTAAYRKSELARLTQIVNDSCR